MNQELIEAPTAVITQPEPQKLIVPKGSELEVTATTPDEMLHANAALIRWCEQKINSLKVDHIELDEACKHAKEKKWKSATLKRHADLAKKRVDFYEKVKAALEAGFYIVPNFPVNLFAIRTNKTSPLKAWTTCSHNYKPSETHRQHAQQLSAGEGQYKDPNPAAYVWESGKTQQGTSIWHSGNLEWDQMEFPLSMSKPVIMEATSRAMALKIFDEFGILEQGRTGDPLIVGRMIDPRSTSKLWPRHLTFIVAWHLNTKTI